MSETLVYEIQLTHDGYMPGALRDPLREPHTLPDAEPGRRMSRQVSMRIRRMEDAWALHANDANGFGGGESVSCSGT